MAAIKDIDVVAALTQRFFGPDFFEQKKVIDKILECRSLSDFQKLKIDFSGQSVAGIFESASVIDTDSKKFTPDRIRQIYNNLKAVRGNTAAVFL